MTKQEQDKISERCRAARDSVAPIVGRVPIPAHQTSTFCKDCLAEVFEIAGRLIDPTGLEHRCKPINDTDRPEEPR